MRREHEFELDGDSIELEITYGTDDPLELPADLKEKLAAYFNESILPRWVKEIERQALVLETDKVDQWLNEDTQDAAEDRAAAKYDEMREYEGKGVW